MWKSLVLQNFAIRQHIGILISIRNPQVSFPRERETLDLDKVNGRQDLSHNEMGWALQQTNNVTRFQLVFRKFGQLCCGSNNPIYTIPAQESYQTQHSIPNYANSSHHHHPFSKDIQKWFPIWSQLTNCITDNPRSSYYTSGPN